MIKYNLLIFLLFLITKIYTQNIVELNKLLVDQSVVDKLSPPVASRFLAYCNLSYYYGMQKFSTEDILIKNIIKNRGVVLHPITVSDSTDINKISQYLFVKTVVKLSYSNEKWISLEDKLDSKLSKEELLIANEAMINISNLIGSDLFKDRLSYKRYEEQHELYDYKYTAPTYREPIENNWGFVKPFLINKNDFIGYERFYTKKKKKSFDKANQDIYTKSKNLSTEEKEIATYWDCTPMQVKNIGHTKIINYRTTPAAHWLMILSNIDTFQSYSDIKKSTIYTVLTIGMADAFIVCWNIKYTTNFIRPITYINNNIDEKWTPYIETPSFPEFPSGHSLVSATAACILTKNIHLDKGFRDVSQVAYIGISRNYLSFTTAAQEAGYSRYLGGIHYLNSIEQGTNIGKEIGEKICIDLGL